MSEMQKQRITGADIVAALEVVAERLVTLREELSELDAAVGDGDLGINMAKGGAALKRFLMTNFPQRDLGRFLVDVGMAFNREASSTMGTLLATAFMRAGREAQGLAEIDAAVLARMLAAADTGIQERGKAKPGDKTIIDALHPAVEAFSVAIQQGADISTAGQAFLDAARAGCEATVPLQSRVGRAGWVGERTRGKPDPGAVLLVRLIEALTLTSWDRSPEPQPG